jgi:glycosyltransferase involved in cell wall biosynthesis
MGRLSREKGLFTLLGAWEEVPNITLEIIGDGSVRNELEAFVIQKGITNVEFLGFIEGPRRFEILRKAMFTIFPSEWYENLPYSIIESFACGTPVIASRIGELKRLVEEGQNGLLFDPGNIEDLRKKILYFMENPKLIIPMRRYARETAEKKYSSEIGYRNLRISEDIQKEFKRATILALGAEGFTGSSVLQK